MKLDVPRPFFLKTYESFQDGKSYVPSNTIQSVETNVV